MLSVLDAFIPQCALTGKEPRRFGNRRAGFAPANVFPVKDGHIYIAASFQTQWESLAKLMGREELIAESRFLTNTERKENESELEAIVEKWSSSLTSRESIALLEGASIPCAPVKSIREVMADEHIKARKSIVSCEYPGIGEYPMAASPVRFMGSEQPLRRAPLLGEHNEEVLDSLLGYSPNEVRAMKTEGIL
jgi:crotonobetainyl-CoA:carnitine CoA-transferase CaiB-like acyl-CoA transferase